MVLVLRLGNISARMCALLACHVHHDRVNDVMMVHDLENHCSLVTR
jgi:hypothetical protein